MVLSKPVRDTNTEGKTDIQIGDFQAKLQEENFKRQNHSVMAVKIPKHCKQNAREFVLEHYMLAASMTRTTSTPIQKRWCNKKTSKEHFKGAKRGLVRMKILKVRIQLENPKYLEIIPHSQPRSAWTKFRINKYLDILLQEQPRFSWATIRIK